jgi:peptidoglycan/LPS O-acetylase OafA/YrhL
MVNGADERSLINRALSTPALVAIGTISYSLYLFHVFIPRLGFYMMGGGVPFDVSLIPAYAGNFFAMLGASLVFAYGMYHFVEVPGQRWLRTQWARMDRRLSTPKLEAFAAAAE